MRPNYFERAGGAVEAVLTGLQHPGPAGHARQQEIPAGAHHTGLHEGVGDTAGTGAARKFDEGLALEALIRLLQAVEGETARGEPHQQKEANQAQESHNESR